MPLVPAAILAMLFLALAIWRREAALAAFCGLLPVYLVRLSLPLGIGTLPSTLLEVFFWELFVAWYFMDAPDAKKPGAWDALEEWAVPLTIFVTAATISVFVSSDLRAALGLWRAYILEPILFFPMFVHTVKREKHGIWMIATLGTCISVIGVTAIYQKITGFGIPNPAWAAAATRRATSFFGFPNAIALLSAPVVTLMAGWSLALLRAKRSTRRLLAILPAAAALLGTCGVVFAVSKGGMIGIAVGITALGLFDKKLRAWTLGAIIAACMVVMLYLPATNFFARIVGFREDSSSVRGIIWSETANMFKDNPVFGAGLSGYPTRIAPYHTHYWIEIFQYPHDILVNFWSETGMLGLGAFIWIIVRFFRKSWKLHKNGWIVATNAAVMITLLIHGLVDVPYFKNDLAFLFWIIVGITESVQAASRASLLDKAKAVVTGEPISPWVT